MCVPCEYSEGLDSLVQLYKFQAFSYDTNNCGKVKRLRPRHESVMKTCPLSEILIETSDQQEVRRFSD